MAQTNLPLNNSSSESSDGEVEFDKMSKEEILENQLSQLRSELEAERKKSQQLKEHAELYKRVKSEMETELSACLDEQATRHHERMKEMVQEFKTGCNIADKVKVSTPIFKGKTGEDPNVHILRVKDWLKAIGSESEARCIDNFYLTLDGDAHQWIDDIGQPTSWEALKTDFCKRFSIQGRSSRHLHHKWRTLSFDPHKDDIDAFVKDVKATTKQLNYEDEAILNTIKTCMPNDIYGAIFDIKELPKLITMVKEFYAARPQASQSTGQSVPTANTFPALPDNCKLYKDFSYRLYLRDLLLLKSFMHIIKVTGNPKEVESLTNPLSPEVEVDPPFLATSMAIGEAMITTLIGDREVDLEVITEVEEDRNLTKVQLPRNPK